MTRRRGLGPFELGEAVGEGGMGFVFRAEHRRTGVPAAIKVIRGASGEQQIENFHREVESHARLVHPGIVTLFEYGRVDGEAVEATDGTLVEGSPFVAMEFADGGTVGDHLPLTSWAEVRHILVRVLDALAFAHARGVVHRDLKPDNFLVFEKGADRVGEVSIKLADFGIAHAFAHERLRDTGDLRAVSGTPYYMPPEQLRGQWRQYGPWTDIYALGCIAWELVCGEPPFDADSAMALGLKHETEERPPLEPRFPVPAGVEAWIHRAMAVEQSARFQRAADAAEALPGRHVEGSEAGFDGVDSEGASEGDDSVATAPTLELSETVQIESPGGDAPPASTRKTPRRFSDDAPPLPSDWRTDRGSWDSVPVVDTGLGLFGLKEIPFVDREAERDALWEQLGEVVSESRLRVTFVRGHAGSGKSRLAEWMVRRAHEVGGTENFLARHAPGGNGAGDGLAGMVARKFHAWNLDRSGVRRVVDHHLPDHPDKEMNDTDVRALTELLRPTDDDTKTDDELSYHFSNHEQRYELLIRLIERYEKNRIPAVWLDDLQWSPDTLGWLEHLLTSHDRPAAWVLATVREDVLADKPNVAEKIDSLVADYGACSELQLDALTLDDHRELIHRLLPLAPDVVDIVAQRTEGNPLFAAQLVGDWVERGRLVVGQEGFELNEPNRVKLPSTIHELWMQRLERAVQTFGGGEMVWEVLELSATLGREIGDAEWELLGDRAPDVAMADLLHALVDRGLARRTGDGWKWTHGMLVSSLRRRAEEAWRLTDHHRRCAHLLSRLDRLDKQTAARRANHWIEAGELDRALEPLLQEAYRLTDRSAVSQARPVLRRRRELLEALELEKGSTEWLEQFVAEADLHYSAGDFADVRATVERLRERASGQTNEHLLADGERMVGNCAVMEADLDRGRRHLHKALSMVEGVEGQNAAEVRGRIYAGIAILELEAGEHESAIESARLGMQAARKAEAPYDRLSARRVIAWVELENDGMERAREVFEENFREAKSFGFRDLQSDCVNGLGGLAFQVGEYEKARKWYERYERMGEELARDSHVIIAKLNIASTYVEQEEWRAARRCVDEAETLIEGGAGIRRDDLVRCLRLAAAAGEGRRSDFERLRRRYEDGWPAEARYHSGHISALEQAGRQAVENFGSAGGREVLTVAHSLWEELGWTERAEEVGTFIDSLALED